MRPGRYDLTDLDNSYAHLTNTSINKNSTSYAHDKEGVRAGCKWSLYRFCREHPDHPLGSQTLWARIKAIVNLTILSIAAQVLLVPSMALLMTSRSPRPFPIFAPRLAFPLILHATLSPLSSRYMYMYMQIPDSGGSFELLGFDVMIDEALRPWLLEVSALPSSSSSIPFPRPSHPHSLSSSRSPVPSRSPSLSPSRSH